MEDGAPVVVRAEHGHLVLEPRAIVLNRLRADVHGVSDVSLVDELLASRTGEARLEREPRRRR